MASSYEAVKFPNPFDDHSYRKGTIDALELVEAVATPHVKLIIGNEEETLAVPEGILKRITYFENCLRNAFEETDARIFKLPDEKSKTVKQLLAYLMHPIDDLWTVQPGEMALLADKWCSFDLRDSILKETWDHWYALRTRTELGPIILRKKFCLFRLETCRHRMRFLPIDFLARLVDAGFVFPQELTSDTNFCQDFAKWRWVRDIDSQRKDDFEGENPPGGPEPFRRLMKGVLSVDWTPESDGTTNFANTFLNT